MNKQKLLIAVAAVCAAFTLTTACGNDKKEELSSSAPDSLETVTEEVTEEETTSVTTAATTKTTPAATTSAVTTATTAVSADKSEADTEPDTESPDNTAGGTADAPIIVIDPNMGQEQQPPVDNGGSYTPAYNEDIKNKLGIEVVLSGTNEQQAQQYYEACKAAYPSLPWTCNGTSAGIDFDVPLETSSIDVWSMTEEEVTAMLNERLAGRDYHDMSIEELYSLMDIAPGCSYGVEIQGYLSSLTYRDFNNGGYHIMQ